MLHRVYFGSLDCRNDTQGLREWGTRPMSEGRYDSRRKSSRDCNQTCSSLGNLEFAELLLPLGGCLLDYAAGCPRINVIQWLLDCGYLRRDVRLAAMAMHDLARSGRLDLAQQVILLHTPFSRNHKLWVTAWVDTVNEVCKCGHLGMLLWLVDYPVGKVAIERMKETEDFCRLLLTAAEGGHVEVMEYLCSHSVTYDFRATMSKAIVKDQARSIKWLLEHHKCDELKSEVLGIDRCARYGQLEILKVFDEFDLSTSYKDVGVKRQRIDSGDSWWSHVENPIYWAAQNGHLAVLKWLQANRSIKCNEDAMDYAAGRGQLEVVKWLHLNRSEGCTQDAMDQAACNGHLDMIQWLHTNSSEGCTRRAMDGVATNGHLDVMQWLHRNRSQGCSYFTIYGAARRGHLEVVKWLYANKQAPCVDLSMAIDRAMQSGHLRVVCWLVSRLPDFKFGRDVLFHDELVTVDWARYSAKNTIEVLLYLHTCHKYVLTSQSVAMLRRNIARPHHRCAFIHQIKNWLDEYYPQVTAARDVMKGLSIFTTALDKQCVLQNIETQLARLDKLVWRSSLVQPGGLSKTCCRLLLNTTEFFS